MKEPWWSDAFSRYRKCPHTPDDVYTREPCSCGRELWPPRGRGRGESLTSPRRVAAKLRALDALRLHCEGKTYARIAQELGYKTPSGAFRAVQRIHDHEAAWVRYEDCTGRQPIYRRQPTAHQLEEALTNIEDRLAHRLDVERLTTASERLRRLLVSVSPTREPESAETNVTVVPQQKPKEW